jgi:hypothetical protein
MNKAKVIFSSIFDERWPSYLMIRILALMNGTAALLFYISARGLPEFATVQLLRQLMMVTSVLIFAFTFIKKQQWRSWYNYAFQILMVATGIIMGWFNHTAMISSKQLWKPFPNYVTLLLILAVIVPASYLLNFILILLTAVEMVVLWFYLDMGSRSNIIQEGEPFNSLALAFVSILILFSRYRYERTIYTLTAERTANKFTNKLARVFLSIRDKSNSPIQTLILHFELLKRKRLLEEERIKPMTNAVATLIGINKRLSKLESTVDWGPKHLLTDSEIEEWLSDLEREAERVKSKNGFKP